ncbi:MAG: hypothetical protein KKA19_09190 [Candidatus Margulisbacteria bacterium]|nr:hypothetical protein [Candidatus Margulisiibacteriota bacterium]
MNSFLKYLFFFLLFANQAYALDAFLNFTIIGDEAFDFFFSIVASLSLLMFIAFSVLTFFRGRV